MWAPLKVKIEKSEISHRSILSFYLALVPGRRNKLYCKRRLVCRNLKKSHFRQLFYALKSQIQCLWTFYKTLCGTIELKYLKKIIFVASSLFRTVIKKAIIQRGECLQSDWLSTVFWNFKVPYLDTHWFTVTMGSKAQTTRSMELPLLILSN